ncbi:DUF262 domain-containing protein [Candidatus Dojkabacteria bacterium]|nr:DUF262 domain-containing protein [Candidatus Dojkabacteria bacterium]
MIFEKKTTQDLFNGSKKYKVPKYQRGYAWKEKIQIQDFWDDIQEVSSDNPLYFGTIILQNDETKYTDVYEIVDGQQRITTLSLLFIACRNHAIKNNYPQSTTLPGLIAGYDIARGDTPEPRLEAGVNVLDAYKFLVENPNYDGGHFPRHIDGRKSKIMKSNYLFFMERVSLFDENELADLLNRILKFTFFLIVVVQESIQAFDIFERTNARGTPLNISDLLKNMLFASEVEINNLTERWDRIVIDSDVRLPRFLKYFDAQKSGHDTGKKVLFGHLKNRAKDMGPADFMDEIEIFSKFYNSAVSFNFVNDPSSRISQSRDFDYLYQDEIFFSRIKRSINAINLSRVQVPLPFIYAGLRSLGRFQEANNRQYSELKSLYVQALNTIECFHFINNAICTTPTNSSEKLYATETQKVTESQTIQECKNSFKRIIEGLYNLKLADRNTFIESFSQITYSPSNNKPLIAYIFDCFQNDPFEKVPNVVLFDPKLETVVNRQYEVEHVAPISTWQGDEDTLNSIGNLLLITHTTNRLVDNKCLLDKVKIYKDRNFDNLNSVKDFVRWIEENNIEELQEKEINFRAIEMAELAYDKIWNPCR